MCLIAILLKMLTLSSAWTTIGHAIRHAVALGLHLRVGNGIDSSHQQLRSCTWWSLYSLEQLLGEFTGRPTSILESDIAIPVEFAHESALAASPTPIASPSSERHSLSHDDSPTGVSISPYSSHYYFVCRVRLSTIGHKIRSSLYACGKPNEVWSGVQQNIRIYAEELRQWSANLPQDLEMPHGIDVQTSDRRGGQLLDHFELAMAYQSIRMILFRPCLCHLDGLIPNESAPSRTFNQDAAVSCITAARDLLALLPDEAAFSHASKMLPWWSLLHYITQVGAVLTLELCLGAEHMLAQVHDLVNDMYKIMRWLTGMAGDSLSAWRCWKIFRKLFPQAAAGVGIEVRLPEDVQRPPGWMQAYETLLFQTLNVPLDQQPTLQMLDHMQDDAEMRPLPAPSYFQVNEEMEGESWPLLSSMATSTGSLAYGDRGAYSRSTGETAGEMDWRT
jgi:Fungal specific transcription factor domain